MRLFLDHRKSCATYYSAAIAFDLTEYKKQYEIAFLESHKDYLQMCRVRMHGGGVTKLVNRRKIFLQDLPSGRPKGFYCGQVFNEKKQKGEAGIVMHFKDALATHSLLTRKATQTLRLKNRKIELSGTEHALYLLERNGKAVQRFRHPMNLVDKAGATTALEAADEIQYFDVRFDLKAATYKFTLVDEATLAKEAVEEKEKLVVKRELFVSDSFARGDCPKHLLLENGLLYCGNEVYQTIEKEHRLETH